MLQTPYVDLSDKPASGSKQKGSSTTSMCASSSVRTSAVCRRLTTRQPGSADCKPIGTRASASLRNRERSIRSYNEKSTWRSVRASVRAASNTSTTVATLDSSTACRHVYNQLGIVLPSVTSSRWRGARDVCFISSHLLASVTALRKAWFVWCNSSCVGGISRMNDRYPTDI